MTYKKLGNIFPRNLNVFTILLWLQLSQQQKLAKEINKRYIVYYFNLYFMSLSNKLEEENKSKKFTYTS